MREIKFRAWDGEEMVFSQHPKPTKSIRIKFGEISLVERYFNEASGKDAEMKISSEIMQYTGLKDKNGKEVWEGDILRFSDKWGWYGREYGLKMAFANEAERAALLEKYEAEPYEERVVVIPDSYEWMLGNNEVQTYWEVIGNIHENPNLLEEVK